MKHLSLADQICAKELEIQILSNLLAIGKPVENVRWSDLCVQRSEAMAALNVLKVRQCRFGEGLEGQDSGHKTNGA